MICNTHEIEQIIHGIDTTKLKNKHVVVTGGAGFIGSWMCETLLSLGNNVTCVDNFVSGQEENIAHLLKEPGFICIKQDVSDGYEISDHVDYILHLASRAGPFEFSQFPIDIIKCNTVGLTYSLELARKNNCTLLFTSTSEIYGMSSVFPTPESYNGNVNSIGPRGCYDESKRCGEALCMAYLNQYDVNIRIARIFNTYGPRIRSDGIYGRVIPRFIDQALKHEPITVFGDGSQTRSFCYITDQIRGLLKLLTKDTFPDPVINIGNPEEVTILELAQRIIEITGSKSSIQYLPLPKDDPHRRLPDISRAKLNLSWEPQVSLNEGLCRMMKWINPEKAS